MESVSNPPISKGIQIGIDIGQRVDPSAIVVCEVELRDYQLERGADKWHNIREAVKGGQYHYIARHISRLPLNTPYPQVAERAAEIINSLKAQGKRPTCYMDATGVGKPVVDLLHAAGAPVIPVFLTGGDRETYDNGEIRLSKSQLVSRLQVLLQTRRVHLPQTDEAAALADELLNYEIRITEAANVQTGVFKIGAHDDLATALGLACRDYRPFLMEIW